MQNEHEQIAQSLLAWWDEAGVDIEPLPAAAHKPAAKQPSPPISAKPPARQNTNERPPDRFHLAQKAAANVKTLDELITCIQNFDAGALSDGAHQAVIARGNPAADVMILGEAPGRDEDRAGKPFVGRSGQFLDKMFAAIDMDESNLYISNGVFWRPKGNRTPTPDETKMCLPFVERHIALIAPKILICVGGSSAKTMLDTQTGITRLRGQWGEYTLKNPDRSDGAVIPLLPMYHPAFVLRKPAAKRECWLDLLSLREKRNDL